MIAKIHELAPQAKILVQETWSYTPWDKRLKKWGIEGEYIGIGNCILGYKDEHPEMKKRKDNYVYYVR